MRVTQLPSPRRFQTGGVELAHVADVQLEPDELLRFRTESGTEYEVVRKAWGYYPLPSLNVRLPAHGLRPLLVRGEDDRVTLLVCEAGKEDEVATYLGEQRLELLAWLDAQACPMCRAFGLEAWHRYAAPPEGETEFDLGGRPYRRELRRCRVCGHFTSATDFEITDIYEQDYVDATYGDRMSAAYDRVMALPPEASDNAARVARIVDALGSEGTVLDVGSGLGVFPARIQEAGWTVTALEPDRRACEHIRARTGAHAVAADFLKADVESLGRFDLVTLNKVLEHVIDPVAMLRRAAELVSSSGSVYIELPDGEAASDEGPGREEFFIEHLHVFSAASIALLVHQAGLRARSIHRLREPSTKYTLFAFCEPGP